MKPIVVKTSDNITIDMTLSEFNEIIEKVYNEGYKDGQKNSNNTNYPYPLTYPSTEPYIHWELPKPEWVDKDYTINPYEVTCDQTTLKEYLQSMESKGE